MMERNRSRSVRDIGERGLIQCFMELITQRPDVLLSGNEDAIAVGIDDKAIVVNTDMLVESTDVLPCMTPAEIAWKAGVMGLSDLAAKGATPYGILVSLGLPETLEEDFVVPLVKGLNQVCREHETYYLGGDTNQAKELIIDCTAIGIVQKKHIIRRNGAKPGDIVAVTGEFGYTGALFEALLKKRDTPELMLEAIRSKALWPRARLVEGKELAKANVVSSGIDSSDGLAWSLHELAKASKVGFRIDQLTIPSICTEFAARYELNAFDLALYGGEEFELVLTIPQKTWSKAVQIVNHSGSQLFPIGKVTKKQENTLIVEGVERKIESRGYEHFR